MNLRLLPRGGTRPRSPESNELSANLSDIGAWVLVGRALLKAINLYLEMLMTQRLYSNIGLSEITT